MFILEAKIRGVKRAQYEQIDDQVATTSKGTQQEHPTQS